jgi:salicylate hydroxylase
LAPSRNVIVAGAGIGGLTAALELARRGFRITLLDQAERLEEAGAGIQLSPNAMRVLLALGFEQRLKANAVAPEAVEIKTAQGQPIARIPLGAHAAARYGAPYWVTHRGDLQSALLAAVREQPDIELKLGTRVEDFILHANGISVACRRGLQAADETGIALIGADGLWSSLRTRFSRDAAPVFRGRTAWRAVMPAERAPEEFRAATVHLWLGRKAHVVHYSLRGGTLINIVAIVDDEWAGPGWTTEGSRREVLSRFAPHDWSEAARALLALPEHWHKWALYDLAPLTRWGDGPVTLLGDAAHPMLPFLAQGAAMAIEDAAVLAAGMAHSPSNPAAGMRAYEAARRARTARVQREARRNGVIYHLGGPFVRARDVLLRATSGKMLLRRYDWLYDWRAPNSPK